MDNQNINPDKEPDQQRPVKKKVPFYKRKKFWIAAVILGLCVWDFADPPLVWQYEAQQSKRLIMNYAHEHYPDARMVESRYETAMPFLTKLPIDTAIFEKDGVRFNISVEDGELLADGYYYMRAEKMIKDAIVGEFMHSRGLDEGVDAYVVVSFQTGDLLYPFNDAPMGDLSNYERLISVYIGVIGKYNSPSDVEWAYDCYRYYKSKFNLKNSDIYFSIENLNPTEGEWAWGADFDINDDIKSPSEFYSKFRQVI